MNSNLLGIYLLVYTTIQENSMGSKIAKIFMNGRSQAVRLPKEYRFDTDEVYVTKQGQNIIISPKKITWDEFFNTKPAFDDDFLDDREDTQPQDRESF